MDLEGLKTLLPARRASTHLAFLGSRLGLVSLGHGKRLTITVGADDPRLAELLTPLKQLLDRPTAPRKVLEVETVNEQPVLESPYAAVLAAHFSATREARTLRLRKRYGAPAAEVEEAAS